jgi:large repetitive protein
MFPQLGDVTVTATYSGDANLLPGSATLKFQVGRVVAGVFVAFTPAAPVSGESVRVSVLATGAPGVVAPTGGILLYDGGVPLPPAALDAEGRGAMTSSLRAGAHPITAVYSGDTNYGYTQATTTLTVAKAGTSTTIAAPAGGAVTAVAAPIAPGSGAPTGAVRFLRDGQTIGTVALEPMGASSSATLGGPAPIGSVTAEYSGDAEFTGSVSAAVVAGSPRVQVTLTSNSNPSAEGEPVVFTATVTPNAGTTPPAGSIVFAADGATLGSTPLAAGRANLTATMAVGSHAMTATYAGDAIYPAASTSLTQVVSAPAANLTLTLVERDPVVGQPVTLMAQVSGDGTGRVEFTDGGRTLGSAALISGVARITVTTLAAGTHAIAASWSAASAQLTLTVNRARTATSLAWSGGLAVAAVSAVAPGAGSPRGSVRFVNAVTSVAVAIAPLAGGTASIPWTAGEPLVAMYAGDESFLPSNSAAASPLAAANAASYFTESFAPDEIVTLFGRNLANAAATVTDSAGAARKAEVLYAAEEQASIVMPPELAAGAAVLRVSGMWLPITISRTAPGVFTADSSGTGAPAGAVDEIDADTGYLALYGTGIRHGTATCTIGGQAVEVVYAGAQGGFAGLDQVNVSLPRELRGAGAVKVVLTVDSVTANAVTIRIR